MRRLGRLFPFVLLVLVTFPFALIPYRLSLRVGDALGLLLHAFWRSRRKIALDNLRAAVERGALTISGSPKEIIQENFRNLGRLLIEVIKIYFGLGGAVFRTVELRGKENFRKAAAKGKGIVFITGHCGNWELMAVYLSMNLTRINVVARRQDNPYINAFIERTRQKYGNSVIYKEGALKKILSCLKRNETVGILMDQAVVTSEGLIIHFLGRNAYTMKTPSLIARKTGASVLPVFISRSSSGHVIEIGGEIPLDASADSDTAVLNDTINFTKPIEDYIRRHPSEWLWIHRRWKRIRG
jgi:KDO2-lipid IV(A) lauroyltransferase